MTTRDRLLALLVAACWGVNFPATHLALHHFPPMLLVALRFALIAVPTLVVVPRPDVAWRWLLGFGAGFGILQFAFLYLAMAHGMPTGLASLVLQSSAPFTVALGGLLLGERLSARQLLGVLVAIGGLAGIAVHQAQLAPLGPILLTLCGGLGWALGNLSSRQARPERPMRLLLWMSVVPPLPMLALSLLTEGAHRDWLALSTVATRQALPADAGLLYVVVVATLLGSGVWTALLSRYPSSTVAPFSMIVPVVGVGASWLLLGERADLVELGFGCLVIAGVLLDAITLGHRHDPARREAVGRPVSV